MTNETGLYTIDDYLRGCVGFSPSDEMIKAVLVRRGIEPGTPWQELDERAIDLAEAELLYRVSRSIACEARWKMPTGSGNTRRTNRASRVRQEGDVT